MRWIPADFPNGGATALMRSSFSEAVASFSLQEAVRGVNALCLTEAPPPLGVGHRVDPAEGIVAEVGVDPRANPTGQNRRGRSEIPLLHRAVRVRARGTRDGSSRTTRERFWLCLFRPHPADPPSADRCGEAPLRGPPSTDLKGSRRIGGEGLDLALGCSPPLS